MIFAQHLFITPVDRAPILIYQLAFRAFVLTDDVSAAVLSRREMLATGAEHHRMLVNTLSLRFFSIYVILRSRDFAVQRLRRACMAVQGRPRRHRLRVYAGSSRGFGVHQRGA